MKFHSTVLFVSNIEKSKDFYTQNLGFAIENDFGSNVILSNGLSIWEIRPEHPIPKQLNTKVNSNRFELYFETNSIEDTFNLLESARVIFLHNIHEEPWGQRTFRFFDPDGHLIEIGEPLEVFVANMHKNGLTAIEISQKSGIAIETVKGILNIE